MAPRSDAVPQAPPGGAEVVAAEGRVTGEQCDDLGRPAAADQRCAVEQGAGQPRVHPDRGQRPTPGGRAAVVVHRAEAPQGLLGDQQGRRRGNVEQGEAPAAGRAPAGQLQREGGEVGGGDLRLVVRGQPVVLGGGPAAVDRARSLPSGPAGALGDRRPRRPHGDQRTQPAGQVGPRDPGQPGVDDDADARHGQAALRERGGQHDPTAGPGLERGVLRRGRQPAVQRQHVGIDPAQLPGDGADLAGAGQEDQHVAGALGQRPADGRGDVREQSRVDPEAVRRIDRGRRRGPDGVDLVQRAGGLDDRGRAAVAAEQRGQPLRLGGRRHGEQLQVRAQRGPDVETEGEREVGVQVPFVALVEDDRVHPGQFRVGLQPADEQAGGDHLDAGRGAAPAVPADAVADPAADGLTQQRGHPARGGAGGDPAWLGDDDAPRQGAGQRERDERRLAGAGRRHEHRGPAGRRERRASAGRAERTGRSVPGVPGGGSTAPSLAAGR